MANVLTTASTIKCNHGGTAILISSAKLKVNGNAVLLDDPISFTPGSCAQVGSGLTPCTKLTLTSGQAAKLTVGGKKVLLDSIAGMTNGVPESTFTVTAGQSKLKAS